MTIKRPARTTWTALAVALGFSREAFYRWRTLPGAPRTPDVAPWQTYIAANNLGAGVGNRVSDRREELLVAIAQENLAALKRKRAREEGQTVPLHEIDALHLHLSTLLKTTLYQRLSRELGPRCEGKSAVEINVVGRAIADELCETFRNGVESWGQDARCKVDS